MQGETLIGGRVPDNFEAPMMNINKIIDDKMHKHVDNVCTDGVIGDRKKLGHRIRYYRERLQIKLITAVQY
jgi:hypothetical protein